MSFFRLTSFALLLTPLLFAQSDGFVSLMPKKDLGEHWTIVGTPPEIWWLENGVIGCKGEPRGFLRSNKRYKNYVLRAEWRFQTEGWTADPPKYPNAGILIFATEDLRERYPHWPRSFVEVQGHFGEAGSVFGGKIQGAKRGPIVKNRIPFGDWDRIEITTHNGTVRAILNGELVNEGHGADPDEGYICLQSEGWPVYYRNVEIKVLPD